MERVSDDLISEFARQNSIDLIKDTKSDLNLVPRLARFDEDGSTVQYISESGALYSFYQIDYYEGDVVRASRTIAEILPGNRTELAYWTQAAPAKTLDIHRGRGRLVIGDPNEGRTRTLPVDSASVSEIALLSGCFYTIQAAEDGTEPLVISGLYKSPVNWDDLEISLNPGQSSIKAPEGRIQVPPDFWVACAITPLAK